MAYKRKKRKRIAAAGYRRSTRQDAHGAFGKLFLLVAMIGLCICLTNERSGPFSLFQQKVRAVFETQLDMTDAIETLGRVFSGQESGEESSIVVFGRMILGMDEEGEDNREDVLGEPIDQAKQEKKQAGSSSGLLCAVAESPIPVLDPASLAAELPLNEADDGTVNEVFKIPCPDIVDTSFYTSTINFCKPLKSYRITSRFGYRIHPISGNTTFHYGADLAAGTGTKVFAVADGKISETGYGTINGKYIKVVHAEGFVSHYTHLHKVHVKEGDTVKKGASIGTVGSTGYSTGPHLHFELRRNGKVLDPFAYFSF